MPIKPENVARYPANWKQLRAAVLERAGNCCEGSPKFPDCRAPNGAYRIKLTDCLALNEDAAYSLALDRRDVSRIVLTIAHLDHDNLETQDITQLRAWCQRCHLNYDKEYHQRNARATRHNRKAVGDMFENT